MKIYTAADVLRVAKRFNNSRRNYLLVNPLQDVMKSSDGSRMNEFKCHLNWARRIKILGELYGVKEES